jgi:hypothetical protein
MPRRLSTWLRDLTHRRRFAKRYDVLNWFARRIRAKSYLEIGARAGRCLDRVDVSYKVGVDPNPRTVAPTWKLVCATSDDFFRSNEERFDLVFIDGLHLAEQVLRDIRHSMEALEPGGAILLHDCNPPTESRAGREQPPPGTKWYGDTWKAIAYLRAEHPGLFVRVLDIDHGVGVVVPGPKSGLPDPEAARRAFERLRWEDLERDRRSMLGLLEGRDDLERALADEA